MNAKELLNDAELFWYNHRRTFTGINAGEYIDKEDFNKFIQSLSSTTPIEEKDLNSGEETNAPQIHLSCTDGNSKDEATQFVFHKMADGELFIEVYGRGIDWKQYQATLNESGKKLLIDFLNNKTTY